VIAFFALAFVGPWIAPYDPEAIDLAHQFELPSNAHWLGTGDNGVDMLSVLLHGARLAGVIAVTVVGLSVLIGTLVGIVAGYRGGKADHAISGLADMLQAFPGIILVIAILASVGEPGVAHLVFAMVVGGWVIYARIARAQTFTIRELEYVQAARALGVSEPRILVRHIVPNLAGPLVVQATSGAGSAILAESTLSFLGLGPGTATSWGAVLDQGSAVLLRFPHVALLSGAAIAITVLGFNLAGDWLRDRLDPKSN
jgi:peptide/nickel transport system permease protein